MLKWISFVCLLVFALGANAESILANYYVIVSDVFDASLKPGTVHLSGRTLDVNENPISGGTVSNFDRSRSAISDSKGHYAMTLSPRDTAIFFYHENYGEVVLWKYNFQSQHRVKIDFISMEYSDIPVVAEKPVIYLSAPEPTAVELSLKHAALTFTYPSYNDGWSVTAQADGTILNAADGKPYPYLFWEAQTENLGFAVVNGKVPGSLIETRLGIEFLEKNLTDLGLNNKEMTDFITYWGPRLQQKAWAFVQFRVDAEVDAEIAVLDVNPKPARQRRVYMLFTLLDQPQLPFVTEDQTFDTFERCGLTLLEWGGSEISLRSMLSL